MKPPTVGGGVGYKICCPVWELSLSALLVLKCSRHAGDLAVWVLSVTVPYRQAGTVSTIVLFQTLKRPALAEKRIDLTESTM